MSDGTTKTLSTSAGARAAAAKAAQASAQPAKPDMEQIKARLGEALGKAKGMSAAAGMASTGVVGQLAQRAAAKAVPGAGDSIADALKVGAMASAGLPGMIAGALPEKDRQAIRDAVMPDKGAQARVAGAGADYAKTVQAAHAEAKAPPDPRDEEMRKFRETLLGFQAGLKTLSDATGMTWLSEKIRENREAIKHLP